MADKSWYTCSCGIVPFILFSWGIISVAIGGMGLEALLELPSELLSMLFSELLSSILFLFGLVLLLQLDTERLVSEALRLLLLPVGTLLL